MMNDSDAVMDDGFVARPNQPNFCTACDSVAASVLPVQSTAGPRVRLVC